jgi:hypothetical protein
MHQPDLPSLTTAELLELLSRELLRDPVPSACPFVLLGAAYSIRDMSEFVEDVPEDIDQLCTLGVKWLTMPRITKEIQTMATLRCDCPSEKRVDEVHEYGIGALSWKDEYHPLIFALMLFFMYKMKKIGQTLGPQRRGRKPALYEINLRKDWPHRIEDILPYGPDDTIRGLLAWLKADLSSELAGALLEVVHVLLSLCNFSILPPIVSSRHFCTHIAHSMSRIIREWIAPESPSEDLSFDKAHHKDFDIYASLLVLFVRNHTNETQRTVFLGDNAEILLKNIAAGTNIVRSLKNRMRLNMEPDHQHGFDNEGIIYFEQALGTLGGLIYDSYPGLRSIPIGARARRLFESHALTSLPEADAIWPRRVDFLLKTGQLQHCSMSGCGRVRDSCSALRQCRGCHRVAYCSVRCQKLAW